MGNHQFVEINDYLNFAKLQLDVQDPDFIIYSYEEVKQESWINLAAIIDGFENLPEAFLSLFTRSNKGKTLVKM